jgi:hypothetical protein
VLGWYSGSLYNTVALVCSIISKHPAMPLTDQLAGRDGIADAFRWKHSAP